MSFLLDSFSNKLDDFLYYVFFFHFEHQDISIIFQCEIPKPSRKEVGSTMRRLWPGKFPLHSSNCREIFHSCTSGRNGDRRIGTFPFALIDCIFPLLCKRYWISPGLVSSRKLPATEWKKSQLSMLLPEIWYIVEYLGDTHNVEVVDDVLEVIKIFWLVHMNSVVVHVDHH